MIKTGQPSKGIESSFYFIAGLVASTFWFNFAVFSSFWRKGFTNYYRIYAISIYCVGLITGAFISRIPLMIQIGITNISRILITIQALSMLLIAFLGYNFPQSTFTNIIFYPTVGVIGIVSSLFQVKKFLTF